MFETIVLRLAKRWLTKEAIKRLIEALVDYLFEHAIELVENIFIYSAEKIAAHSKTDKDDKWVAGLKKDLKKDKK